MHSSTAAALRLSLFRCYRGFAPLEGYYGSSACLPEVKGSVGAVRPLKGIPEFVSSFVSSRRRCDLPNCPLYLRSLEASPSPRSPSLRYGFLAMGSAVVVTTGFHNKRTVEEYAHLTGYHLRPAAFSRPGSPSRLRSPNWAFARFGHCQSLYDVSFWFLGVPSLSLGHCQFLLGSIWFIGIPSIMPVTSGVCSIVPSWDAASSRAFPHRFFVLAHASAFGDGGIRQGDITVLRLDSPWQLVAKRSYLGYGTKPVSPFLGQISNSLGLRPESFVP